MKAGRGSNGVRGRPKDQWKKIKEDWSWDLRKGAGRKGRSAGKRNGKIKGRKTGRMRGTKV